MTDGLTQMPGRLRPPSRWLATAAGIAAAALLRERERWVLWAPVLLAAGIVTYFAVPHEPSPTRVLALFAVATFALGLGLWRRQPGFGVLAAVGGWLGLAGYALAVAHAHAVAAPVLAKPYDGEVTGRVVAIESFERAPRILLDRVSFARPPEAGVPARVRISLLSGERVHTGERLTVPARLAPPPGPVAPGAFDFRRVAWFDRLGGTGFAVGHTRSAGPVDDGGSLRLWLAGLRQSASDRIRAAGHGDSGAIATALMTGDRSGISREAISAMRDSGLAHLLAISGLHMGLVAATLFFAIRAFLAMIEPLALRYPIKKWAAAGAIAGSFAYLLLSGATVPTQRAFVMTGLVLLAVLLDRTALSLRLVAAAAFVVLLVAPQDLLGASFQMSFAAVVALIAAYEAIGDRWGRRWRRGRERGWPLRVVAYPAGVALTTVIAGLATGLFGAYHFGTVAGYGVAANVLAIPITAFWVMPWAVVAGALLPFGLERLPVMAMEVGIDAILSVARTVASWPGAVLRLPAMPDWGLGVLTVGGLWLCLWRSRARLAGLVGLGIGVASIWIAPQPQIFVSGTARLVGIAPGDGRFLVNDNRVERRTRERWQAALGLPPEQRSPPFAKAGEPFSCDRLGCIVRVSGRTVAVVYDERALHEDCEAVEVVIALVPTRWHCRAPAVVIDRFDLWRHGAHAISILADGTATVESVADRTRVRPWAPLRGN